MEAVFILTPGKGGGVGSENVFGGGGLLGFQGDEGGSVICNRLCMLMMEIKRILHSLEEGSVKLSRGTTRIPTSPSPLIINNDQSLIQKSMMLTINFFTISN